MDRRVDVLDSEIEAAFRMLRDGLIKRVAEKGRKSFMGMGEIYGTTSEEFNLELLKAMHERKPADFIAESVDVAVGMLFGIASLLARKRSEDAEAAAAAGGKPA